MALPFFFTEVVSSINNIIVLTEENSRHIVQVLRMAEGRQINITDGLGTICTAEIVEANKKKCTVKTLDTLKQIAPAKKVCIAISPVKNSSRFEWFLEKVTEIGVTEIVPLICERTEKQYLKHDRLRGILISAMLQSQQAWLPVLCEPVKFEKLMFGSTSCTRSGNPCKVGNLARLLSKNAGGIGLAGFHAGKGTRFSWPFCNIQFSTSYTTIFTNGYWHIKYCNWYVNNYTTIFKNIRIE